MTVKNEQGQDKDRRDREGQSRNTKYRTEGRRTQQIKEGQDRREKECTVQYEERQDRSMKECTCTVHFTGIGRI